jgi:hypothetical protein
VIHALNGFPLCFPTATAASLTALANFGKQELLPGWYYVSGYVDDAFDVVVENGLLQSCRVRRVPLYNCVSFREQCGGHHGSKFGAIANEDCDDVLVGNQSGETAAAQVPGRSKEEDSHGGEVFGRIDAAKEVIWSLQ